MSDTDFLKNSFTVKYVLQGESSTMSAKEYWAIVTKKFQGDERENYYRN